jgi:hypothetical protein
MMFAPSSFAPGIGRVGTFDRITCEAIDAVIFGIVIFVAVRLIIRIGEIRNKGRFV